MTYILGIAQGWWSVAGLSLDIIGVGLLLREVWLSSSMWGDAAFVPGHENLYEIKAKDLSVLQEEAEERIPEMLKGTRGATRRALEEISKRLVQTEVDRFVDQQYQSAFSEVSNIARRKLFKFAAVIIVLGFALQIVGSLPIK